MLWMLCSRSGWLALRREHVPRVTSALTVVVCRLLQKSGIYTLEPRAAAAVGQSGLMSLYDAMFAQYGVRIAQVRKRYITRP